jgi:sulfur-oxidizing protein SoxX
MSPKSLIATAVAVTVLAGVALAQQAPPPDAARIDAAIAASWPKAPADWKPRFVQDETMRQCSAAHAGLDKATLAAVEARAKSSIEYPQDGKFLGDWRKGEAIAQSGYGLRFTDTNAQRPNGGNCYACHQIDKKEVSFGTIGPSLASYGADRKFTDAAAKAVYEKIYNPHASFPCSVMPRFGKSGVLTVAQIKDLVALLMDPESPVNK